MTPLREALTLERLEQGWARARRSPGPGVDGVHGARFQARLQPRLARLREALLGGTYAPAPLLRRVRPKPDGGERVLGIPTMTDRVAQQAVLLCAAELDGRLLPGVHGYRPGRSPATAIRHLLEQIGARPTLEIVQADVRSMFDELEHGRLSRACAEAWEDPLWLDLCGRWARAWATSPGRGVPQGAPLSPMLANLYMACNVDVQLQGAQGPGASWLSPNARGSARARLSAARQVLHQAILHARAEPARLQPAPELCAWIRYGDDLVLASARRGGGLALLRWLDGLCRAAGLALGDRKTVICASRDRMPLPRPILGVPMQIVHGPGGWSLSAAGPVITACNTLYPWEI